MTRSRVTTLTVVLTLLGGIVLSGAAVAQTSSGSSGSPSSGKLVLHVGTTIDMVSVSPFKALYSSEYEMMFNAYDMLFNFGAKDLTPAPGLATKCDPSADYMTWTCDIRSGVKWSDGQDLTAADIAFTYNFIVKNGMDTYSGYLPFDPTFSAPNATTLIWKSSKPTFAPETPPWIPILPEHVWKQFDGNSKGAKTYEKLPAVGSGPFVLTSWKPNQSWTMTANKSYWGGSPTIDEINYQHFDSKEAMVQALKAGQIDFADDLTPILFNSLKGQPNIGTVAAAASYFDNLAFNFGGQDKVDNTSHPTNDPALKDLRVRQAIEMAIDKQQIVKNVWQGDAQVGTVVTLPSRPSWFYTPTDVNSLAYNPDQANTLLDQAGYSTKNSDGIRLENGKPINLDILTISDLAGSNDTGKLIQADLKQVGIGVTLHPVSTPKADALWYAGDYDAYVWDWGGDPDPDFILSLFTTDQCLSYSDGCYSDPAYDTMYEHQKTIFDKTQRATYIDQMQQYIFDKIPEIVLNYPNYLQAYRTDRFTGYVPTPENGGTYLYGWGPYSYINLKPVSATTASGSSNGIPAWVWIVGGIAVVVAIALLAVSRRRRTEEEA